MIWRAAAPADIRTDVALPGDPVDGALVGSFDLAGIRELGRWRRLFQTSLPTVALRTVLIAETWSPKSRSAAEAAFPPSELAAIQFVEDPEGRWKEAIGAETVFAAITAGGKALCLVLGGPGDEAWDRLEEAASL